MTLECRCATECPLVAMACPTVAIPQGDCDGSERRPRKLLLPDGCHRTGHALPMAEHTEIVNLGFSVADAESPRLQLERQVLVLDFADWKENQVRVRFSDVIAARWQEAEYVRDEHERFDSTHVVHESAWLAEHERQNITWDGAEHRHLKLNFNAAGILEVLCTDVHVET